MLEQTLIPELLRPVECVGYKLRWAKTCIVLWSNLPGHLNRWKIHHLRSYTWQQENVRHLIPA